MLRRALWQREFLPASEGEFVKQVYGDYGREILSGNLYRGIFGKQLLPERIFSKESLVLAIFYYLRKFGVSFHFVFLRSYLDHHRLFLTQIKSLDSKRLESNRILAFSNSKN